MCSKITLLSLWTAAIVTFIWQPGISNITTNNENFTWSVRIFDPIFGWPISVENKPHGNSELILGFILAGLAILTTSFTVNVHSFEDSNSWPYFLFWQAIGGLCAAILGKHRTLEKFVIVDKPHVRLCELNRTIPFEDVLTILVSIFLHLDDERKGRESVRLT